jgi:type IV fimbrial biogenesis protein FimT
MMTRLRLRGFSLIELMVVIAIIAIMLAIAVPSFGNSVRASKERSVAQRMTQDFLWARGAAGANDASTLSTKIVVAGVPTITFVVRSDCSWTTAINGIPEPDHTMSAAAVTAAAPGVSCGGTGLTLPATFTFTPQGFVDTTGTLLFTGTAYAAPLKFQILYSGAIFRAASSAS